MLRAKTLRSVLAAVVLLATSGAFGLLAQPAGPTRVRGAIEKVEADALRVKTREGNEVIVYLGEKTDVIGLKKIALSDIEPNAFVGVAALPRSDGIQTAISIHVFPEASRGFNEGSRGYDVRPNSSMTNGALANRFKQADGDVLIVTYKDGEKKFIVTPETSIVRFQPGERSELRAETKIVATVVERPDGRKEAIRINVGRDGITPAM